MKGTISHKKTWESYKRSKNLTRLTLIHLQTKEQSLPPWPSEYKFGSSRLRRLWESHHPVSLAINSINIVIIINIARFPPRYFWNCGQHCPQINSKHCPWFMLFLELTPVSSGNSVSRSLLRITLRMVLP